MPVPFVPPAQSSRRSWKPLLRSRSSETITRYSLVSGSLRPGSIAEIRTGGRGAVVEGIRVVHGRKGGPGVLLCVIRYHQEDRGVLRGIQLQDSPAARIAALGGRTDL